MLRDLSSLRAIYDINELKYFPLVFGTKEPAVSHGFRSTNQEILETMSRQVSYNLAIICGEVSGNLAVLDFEKETDAWLFFNKERILESTLTVRSAHGGVHIYFRVLGKCPARQTGICAPNHPFDLCGEGGYVVAPPSVIDHTACKKGKDGCERSGTSIYEIISSTTEIVLLKDLDRVIRKKVDELGWSTFRSFQGHPLLTGRQIKSPIFSGRFDLDPKSKELASQALGKLWFKGQRYLLQVATVGWLLRIGVSEGSITGFIVSFTQEYAFKIDGEKWSEQVQQREIKQTIDSAARGARINGLSTLIGLARIHGLDNVVHELLMLHNKILTSVIVDKEILDWMTRNIMNKVDKNGKSTKQ